MYINNNFISKLETVNYYIDSFDANIELSKKLIMANSNISRKEADDILENMPTSYRASIMNKNNEYIGYIGIYDIDYKNSVASIRFEVNKKLLDILNYTSMNYYGHVPYSAKNFDKIESSLMFQHIPNMKKQSRIVIPDNRAIPISLINTNKKEMNLKIELPNGYKMISPKLIKKENIDFNKLVEQHIRIMQDRDNFAIPIGEDKYFLQKGSEKYGIIKALNNYNYLLLDDKNNYVGYINTLRENADGKNVEIEIGISPNLHHNGLGTLVATKFYDELFSIGVASISSTVFEFNIPSIKLHEKLAKLNGIRLESYYINGRLWNMNYYSKTNSKIK